MNIVLPKLFVCFHKNCQDGMAAAWVVRKELGRDNVDLLAVEYNKPPPDMTGRHVIIVDFSYKLNVLQDLIKTASSILILDHHKTAQDELRCLNVAPSWPVWQERIDVNNHVELGRDHCAAIFDMSRAGVRLAWDYFFPEEPMPVLFEYIEDRDLWRKPGMQHRDAVHLSVASYPLDFVTWDSLVNFNITHLQSDGLAIQRKQRLDIEKIIAETKRSMLICGYVVEVVNIPHSMASDAGEIMSHHVPFAASYYDTPTSRNFSLRSSSTGIDVSEIARHYGGGGHRNAAGFAAPLNWEGDLPE